MPSPWPPNASPADSSFPTLRKEPEGWGTRLQFLDALAVDEASSHGDGDRVGAIIGGQFGKNALHVALDGGFDTFRRPAMILLEFPMATARKTWTSRSVKASSVT